MNLLAQLRTAPNQLTLLRLIFIPFIIINVVDGNYGWAMVLFVLAGVSDGLDGLLARWLHQRTVLGQYLDPIADKLLLSGMFLVLSFEHKIPWKFTILVLSRDICIVLIAGTLYATATLRDFRPSLYGKLNTIAQIATLALVMMAEIWPHPHMVLARQVSLWTTFALTLISGIHYIIWTGQRMYAAGQARGSAQAH